MSASVSIVCVPPFMMRDALPRIKPHLLRGAEVARTTAATIIERVESGDALVWMAVEGFPSKTLGVFVTEIRKREDGGKHIFVSACSGTQLKAWAIRARDRLDEFARKEGCDRIRFAGRYGWSRVFGRCHVVGGTPDGAVYERAVQ